MITVRRFIINALVWLLVRVSSDEITDALAALWLRERGHVVMDKATTHVTLAALSYTREKLRKLGGGNVSKLRDPRKTLMRLARNFERVVQDAERRGSV